MSSSALHTSGIQLKRGDAASPEVFTAIGQITGLQGPGGSAQVIDVTDLDSTRKEKKMGLPDEGQITFDINYIPSNAQHSGLRADRAARTLRNFQITYSDSPVTTDSFSAYVLSFQINSQLDGVIKASVTLEITGAVTTA